MRLDLGCPVRCSDADFGELDDVVLEPGTKRVTHVVVSPHGRPGDARLVPVALAGRGEGHAGLQLTGTVKEVEALEALHETEYVRIGDAATPGGAWDAGIEDVQVLPSLGGDYLTGSGSLETDPHVIISYDRVPKGDVEIRSRSTVCSSDGHVVGHVDGLVTDDADWRLTHVVLVHGHLWGKREVNIPVADVETLRSDEVRLRLTKDEVGALKQVKPQRD